MRDTTTKAGMLQTSEPIKADPQANQALAQFLVNVGMSGGTVSVTSDEVERLEADPDFSKALRLDLIRVDAGGEWCDGGIVYLTKKGQSFLKASGLFKSTARPLSACLKRWAVIFRR